MGNTSGIYSRRRPYLDFLLLFLFFSFFLTSVFLLYFLFVFSLRSKSFDGKMSIPIFVKKEKGNPPNARTLREVQIRGGLVPPGDFPGTTDYQNNFKGTPLNDDTSPFVINPPMNLATNGRPAAKNTWKFPWSENQYRYQWPHCKDIDKLPWVKDLN